MNVANFSIAVINVIGPAVSHYNLIFFSYAPLIAINIFITTLLNALV